MYVSQVDNYALARQAPGGPDTSFGQNNMATNMIKKWKMIKNSSSPGFLGHRWTRRRWNAKRKRFVRQGKALYLKDAEIKFQVVNIDPLDEPGDMRSAVILGLEYDQISSHSH